YSSRGPSWYNGFAKPDLIAPGHKLPSSTTTDSYLYTHLVSSQGHAANGDPLLFLSGTSMSAGVASGVVALMLDAHNRNGFSSQAPLTANVVKAMLQDSAIRVHDADYLMQGAGGMHAAGGIPRADQIYN